MIMHQAIHTGSTRVADETIAALPTSRNSRFTGYLYSQDRYCRSAGGPNPGLNDKNVIRMFLF